MSVLSQSRRRTQKDQTRTLVLGAARDLLAGGGLAAMSTRAVAERAGVAVGTVFLHFPDKGSLVEALLHDQIEVALEEAIASLPAGDLVAQLVHVAGRLYHAYDANPALSRLYLRESLFLPSRGLRPLSQQLRRFEEWASARCADALARREIEPIEPSLAFAAFFSFYLAALVAGLRGDLTPSARIALLESLLRRHFHLEGRR